jgi:branched-chain amino acid transport system ATP-binding protein
VLEVKDIHTYYGLSYVLQGVSLRVEKGSSVAVLGRNGVGKTTLIRSIIGFTPPARGSIVFKDAEISHLPPYEIVKAGIGLVPQGRRIFPSLTARENLTVAARVREGDWDIEKVFSLFPRLKERANQIAGKFSGGEQQMLTIGRALVCNPDLLLLDEPSEGLAPLVIRELSMVLNQLKQTGLSMLLVEQRYDLVMKRADYVYIMTRGRITYESTPQQIFASAEVKTKYLSL